MELRWGWGGMAWRFHLQARRCAPCQRPMKEDRSRRTQGMEYIQPSTPQPDSMLPSMLDQAQRRLCTCQCVCLCQHAAHAMSCTLHTTLSSTGSAQHCLLLKLVNVLGHGCSAGQMHSALQACTEPLGLQTCMRSASNAPVRATHTLLRANI